MAIADRVATVSKNRAAWAMIFSIIITGSGHMIIGRVKRGALILIGAILIGAIGGWLLGLWVLAISLAYVIWQAIDLYKIMTKLPELQ